MSVEPLYAGKPCLADRLEVGVDAGLGNVAAYEMERLGYSFWMFLDEGSKQINLIFKRLDGTYGLIKPIKKK